MYVNTTQFIILHSFRFFFFIGNIVDQGNLPCQRLNTIMSATRPKRTKIGDFSAQGWNLPKMHMPTYKKRRVVVNHTSVSSVSFIAYDKRL